MSGEVCCQRTIHQLPEVVPIIEHGRSISQYRMWLALILYSRLAKEESVVFVEVQLVDRQGEDFHNSNVRRHFALHHRTFGSFSEHLIGLVNHKVSIAPHTQELERSRQGLFVIDTDLLSKKVGCTEKKLNQANGSYRLRQTSYLRLE